MFKLRLLMTLLYLLPLSAAAASWSPLSDPLIERDIQRHQLREALSVQLWPMAHELFDQLDAAGESFDANLRLLRVKAALKTGHPDQARASLARLLAGGADPADPVLIELQAELAKETALAQRSARFAKWRGEIDDIHTAAVDGLILASASQPNALEAKGRNLLHYALAYGTADDVGALVAEGANPNQVDTDGYSPLMYGLRYNRVTPETLAALLASPGLDLHLRDDSWSALLLACRHHRNVYALSQLLQAGANAGDATNNGWTCLHLRARYYSGEGNLEMLQLLLDHGASVHARTNHGYTPLHMTALIHGGIPAARFLLANGADANARNNDGERPRDLADDRDLDELERLLK